MVRILSFILFAFAISCTIIEDGDITNQVELDNLRFKSIEIKQETNSGTSAVIAKVTTDSVVSISVPGGAITRTLWMDWPSLGNKKLKFKSGVTTAVKSYSSYLSSGKPYTFYFFDSDTTLLELYRFRYDANGRLNKIVTFILPVEGEPPTSSDTLIYNTATGNLIRIDRRSSDPAKAGTFLPGSGNVLSTRFDFQGLRYEYGCPPSPGCGSLGPDYTSNQAIDNPGLNFGVVNVVKIPGQYISIHDSNFCANCEKKVDTFYFHPLMILRDQFSEGANAEGITFGDQMLFFYMVDWWQPISAQEATKDESVTFSFKYGL